MELCEKYPEGPLGLELRDAIGFIPLANQSAGAQGSLWYPIGVGDSYSAGTPAESDPSN